MSYPRLKVGGYTFGEKLPSSHMTTLDLNVSKALNGQEIWTYVDNTNVAGDPADVETFAWVTIANDWTKSAAILVDVPGMVVGDVLLASIHVGEMQLAAFGSSTAGANFRLYAIDDQAGTPTETFVTGAFGRFAAPIDESVGYNTQPIHLAGKHTVADAGTTRIGLAIRLTLAGVSYSAIIRSGVFLKVQRV
jgi:hypothetical protein